MDRLSEFLTDHSKTILMYLGGSNWAEEHLLEIGRLLVRGWQIERARTARLRLELAEAREIADELESMMDEPRVMPWSAQGTIFGEMDDA